MKGVGTPRKFAPDLEALKGVGTPREKPYVQWTPELEAELNRLWVEEEMTAGQIAAHFGGFTRGQIIGKRNRLIAAGQWRGSVSVGRSKPPRLHPIKPKPKPKPKPVKAMPAPKTKPPKSVPAPAPKPKKAHAVKDNYKPKTSFPWDENMFLCTKCMRRKPAHLFNGDYPFTCVPCRTPQKPVDGRRRR